MKFFGLGLLLMGQMLWAATETISEACEIKNHKSMEVSVLASNLANFNTTRTPEGGPYKRQRLVCKDHSCQLEKFANVIIKYQPDHPDADENGYVKYPDIDLQEEINTMRVVQRELESANKDCERGLKQENQKIQ